MPARLNNLVQLLPDAMEAVSILQRSAHSAGVAPATLELVHLRASQINGCSVCVDLGAHSMKKNGETDDRLFAVAAWRETGYFTAAERAIRSHASWTASSASATDPSMR